MAERNTIAMQTFLHKVAPAAQEASEKSVVTCVGVRGKLRLDTSAPRVVNSAAHAGSAGAITAAKSAVPGAPRAASSSVDTPVAVVNAFFENSSNATPRKLKKDTEPKEVTVLLLLPLFVLVMLHRLTVQHRWPEQFFLWLLLPPLLRWLQRRPQLLPLPLPHPKKPPNQVPLTPLVPGRLQLLLRTFLFRVPLLPLQQPLLLLLLLVVPPLLTTLLVPTERRRLLLRQTMGWRLLPRLLWRLTPRPAVLRVELVQYRRDKLVHLALGTLVWHLL